MGFGFIACCRARGLRAMSSMRPQLRSHDAGDGPRPTGSTSEALVRALLAYKRGEPRVCAMVRTPTPEEEDRRRLCRERKTLTNERVQHVNRIKGLLFCQGISDYEPLLREHTSQGKRGASGHLGRHSGNAGPLERGSRSCSS
jgi:transposase